MCVCLCDVRVCVGKFIVGECAAGPLYKTMPKGVEVSAMVSAMCELKTV